MGMGTNTALPIFAYYTKYINSDDSLNISQSDFDVPEGVDKSPLNCDYIINNSKLEYDSNDEWDINSW